MVSKNVEITNQTGLHARPATTLINIVKQYKCKILIYNGAKQANAGSIINLLTLGVKAGVNLKVECDGEGEVEALAEVSNFLETFRD